MIRGTTAQFKFKMPYMFSELEWVNIVFWQANNQRAQIKKAKNDCRTTESLNEIVISLTAEETMFFSDKYKAKTQLKARHAATGAIFGTKPQTFSVYPMADNVDNIVDDGTATPPTDTDGWVILDGGVIVEA